MNALYSKLEVVNAIVHLLLGRCIQKARKF